MSDTDPSTRYDAVIIGGGPSGATAGLLLARAGMRVIILDKESFPRFRIGESFLPRCLDFIRDELKLENEVLALPQVPKWGAEFAMGDCPDDQTTRFRFSSHLVPTGRTMNIERAVFDRFMLEQARAAGVVVRERTAVASIDRVSHQDVQVTTAAGKTVQGRWLLDASSQATVLAKHLGTKVLATDPDLRKVAYFAHFEGVRRLPGEEEGHPFIVMSDEGWFWVIPINKTVTSVGLVMNADIAKTLTDVPADERLAWGISRCPVVRGRMRNAFGPAKNQVIADFTYRCAPFAGPGYFLLGDAAAFVDPIFSTGVCLGMMSASEAAKQIIAVERDGRSPDAARRQYIKYVDGSTGTFFKLIRSYYKHGFREMFLNGAGPMQMHRAVLAILAGHVFPKPRWKLRWRLAAFYQCLRLQEWGVPLVPRRARFSLRAQQPAAWGASEHEGQAESAVPNFPGYADVAPQAVA